VKKYRMSIIIISIVAFIVFSQVDLEDYTNASFEDYLPSIGIIAVVILLPMLLKKLR